MSLFIMSSLRNSVHRRNHKERSQLVHRTHLGILEKHADYVKRSRDYHSKQDRINRLRQKAAERNKDEFYFAMVNERTQVRSISNIFNTSTSQLIGRSRAGFISRTEGMLPCPWTSSKS